MKILKAMALVMLFGLFAAPAQADEYDDTIKVFREAGESAKFFKDAYGYAVFPTIGKGGIGVGGAHGSGRVYQKGAHVGDASMTQLTIGLQLGAQAFSQIIFFEDKRSFDDFTSGNFEFGAQASAVAITAGASAQAGTTGTSASGSGTQDHAQTKGAYNKGMAVFTVAKGGLMYEASLGGQKFRYTPKGQGK
jgi:lipid-binding SYLF domain-containing protein